MDITRTTIPDIGIRYDLRARSGHRFGLLVELSGDHPGRRTLLVHEAGGDPDDGSPAQQIVLEPDEADQVADLLHQRSAADRLAELERRVAELLRTRA